MIQAQLYNGQVLEFPDGTADDVINKVVKQETNKARYYEDEQKFQQSFNPTEGMSKTEQFLAGAGKGMTDMARGVGQVAGVVSEQDIEASRKRDAPLMETGAGQFGNVAGILAAAAPAMFIPGANTVAGSTLTGAGIGALAPKGEGESRLGNAVIGGAGGLAGGALTKALARVLNPQTSQQALNLMKERVTPTPGQIVGGAGAKVESALESIPLVGSAIRGGKEAANIQFNRAAINRALAPIGKEIDDVGHSGVTQAREMISQAYDDAIAGIKRVDLDQTFDDAIAKIRQMTGQLPARERNQIERVIQENLSKKITPARTMSGETFKEAESFFKGRAAKFGKSLDPNQQDMGDAFNAIAGELRALAGRNNPQAAQALKKADTAYANLLRVERAAKQPVDGVFSPAQLGQAVKGMDGSLRGVQTSQGRALMQDLSNSGRAVLGEKLPNSGTADRLAHALMVSGGPEKVLAGAAGNVLTGGAYSNPGRSILAAALAKRPKASRTLGNYVQRLAPLGTLAGTDIALNQ